VCLSAQVVEIFHKGKRVASHPQSPLKGRHSTVAAHIPKAHQHYAAWTPQRLILWAAKTGEATAQVVETILASRPHPLLLIPHVTVTVVCGWRADPVYSGDARGLTYAVVRGGQHVPMLLRHRRHLILLLSLLSGMLFGVRSAAALDVGDKAPDFTLPSTTGESISLHQFLGKKHLLIEFYVRAFGLT
jgi:hypothetical protein